MVLEGEAGTRKNTLTSQSDRKGRPLVRISSRWNMRQRRVLVLTCLFILTPMLQAGSGQIDQRLLDPTVLGSQAVPFEPTQPSTKQSEPSMQTFVPGPVRPWNATTSAPIDIRQTANDIGKISRSEELYPGETGNSGPRTIQLQNNASVAIKTEKTFKLPDASGETLISELDQRKPKFGPFIGLSFSSPIH
jgi:hypothetical protein